MATRFPILSRHRDRQFGPARLEDFTLGPAKSADLGTLADPLWSLYALDLEGDTAIFVRLAPETDLSAAPFLQLAQFQSATEVLTMPLEALLPASQAVPQPESRIFLFSIGRCGTTLAHHILNTVPGVLALSEPRAFVTLAMARLQMPEARAQELITATTRLAFRPFPGRPARALAIKLHSQALFQAELYHRAFPDARLLFLYRDALGWAASFSRFLQKLGTATELDPAALARTWSILTANAPLQSLRPWCDPEAPVTPHAPLLAAGWAMAMQEVQRLQGLGLPLFTLRYDDLNRDREATIRALLAHCGLPDSDLPRALAAFDRDSQEGTDIARGGQTLGFTPKDEALLLATLSRAPAPLNPDLRL